MSQLRTEEGEVRRLESEDQSTSDRGRQSKKARVRRSINFGQRKAK
ncbi:hypothetical protein ACFYKX_26965 [Cytobacillus sp. FJAT-54145]|uniref:Uncharacterized protein n=1 Tax=Cytobacillus spartinae TaxID=3299023 RepID=A0ABW6KLT4_9BACI